MLQEHHGMVLLEKESIKVPPHGVARTPEEAQEHARKIGKFCIVGPCTSYIMDVFQGAKITLLKLKFLLVVVEKVTSIQAFKAVYKLSSRTLYS